MSLFAGTLPLPVVRRLAAGFLGRLLRSGVIVAVPALGRRIAGGHG